MIYLPSKDQRFWIFIFTPEEFFSLKKTLILAFETNSATSLNCTFLFFFNPNVVDRKCKAHGIFNNILTFWHHTVIKYSTIYVLYCIQLWCFHREKCTYFASLKRFSPYCLSHYITRFFYYSEHIVIFGRRVFLLS